MAISNFRLKIGLALLLCISPQFALADGGLYQLHDDGQIWAFDGRSRCPDDLNAFCPGWSLIDRNPATQSVAAGKTGLFQLHKDKTIWRATGELGCPPDPNAFCPGWTLIDRNPNTKEIVAGMAGLFQLHQDGKIWKYDGNSKCPDDVKAFCPGWTLIDRNQNTAEIIVAGAIGLGFQAFQRHKDGSIFGYDGTSQCPADINAFCPGWTLIDRNPATTRVTLLSGTAVQLHNDKQIWIWRGTAEDGCPADLTKFCTGWVLVDRNPRTQATIAASEYFLYQRHVDGKIWMLDGKEGCPADINVPCPGWTLIDRNTRTQDVAFGTDDNLTGALYQIHVDGKIWKYDGNSKCPDDVTAFCPGWTLIDRNPHTKFISGRDGLFVH